MVRRDVLTLLGCSGFLLAAMGSPARALMPPGYTDVSAKVGTQTVTAGQEDSSPMPGAAYENRIKQKALELFNCTCANCMNTVRQMIQQGRVTL